VAKVNGVSDEPSISLVNKFSPTLV